MRFNMMKAYRHQALLYCHNEFCASLLPSGKMIMYSHIGRKPWIHKDFRSDVQSKQDEEDDELHELHYSSDIFGHHSV